LSAAAVLVLVAVVASDGEVRLGTHAATPVGSTAGIGMPVAADTTCAASSGGTALPIWSERWPLLPWKGWSRRNVCKTAPSSGSRLRWPPACLPPTWPTVPDMVGAGLRQAQWPRSFIAARIAARDVDDQGSAPPV